MSEGLRQFRDVNDRRRMVVTNQFRRFDVRGTQLRIVPASRDVDIDAGPSAHAVLESFQDSRDVSLRHLKRIGNGDPEAVIPDRQQHRNLQDADRIDRFPEEAFGASGVADRAENDFIAVRMRTAQLVSLSSGIRR